MTDLLVQIDHKHVTNCDNNNEIISFENYLYCETKFFIDWFNVNYLVYPTIIEKLTHRYQTKRNYSHINKVIGPKRILKNLNGSFQSGKLSAIMGPSGAGKSTLIECLAGIRKTGLKGDIMCKGKSKVSKSFIPQDDNLYGGLTVKESLTYSYGLKYGSRFRDKPSMDLSIVESLLHQLHLVDCSDTLAGLISGGQKKRTLVAQELISKPDILFIDEPTSGLDSLSCQLLIQLLQKLAVQSSIAIIITIHQPSAKVFSYLHDVYMLSTSGQAFYHGNPQQVISTIESMGIKCDPLSNPADLLIELAFGEYGAKVVDKMTTLIEATYNSYSDNYNENQSETKSLLLEKSFTSINSYPTSYKTLSSCYTNRETSFRNQFKILISRQFTLLLRSPSSSVARFIFSILIVAILSGLYSGKGIYDGCLPNIKNSSLHELTSIRDTIELYAANTKDNSLCFIILCLFITLINLLPMVALIPQDMKLLRKEHFNGWYQVSAYFAARYFADLPFIILSNLFCVTGLFIFTSQPFSRYFQCLFIFTILSLIASTQGFITGIIFMNDIMSSVVAGPCVHLIFLAFSGYFSPVERMPLLFRLLSWFSYLRHGITAYTIAIFKDRCNPESFVTFNQLKTELVKSLDTLIKLATTTLNQWSNYENIDSITNDTIKLKETIVDNLTHSWFQSENQSFIFDYLSLKKDSYNEAIVGLITSLMVSQLLAFYLIKLKVNY